jgi:hypothetical protein
MALTIDGTGATNTATGTTTIAAAITTTQSNDIIIAFIHSERTTAQGSPANVTNVSGGGLTWHMQNQLQYVNNQDLELWWAAATSPLTAQTITATFSVAIDDASIQLIAVNGCGNLATPWDNFPGGWPATQNSAGSATPSKSISTATANTMLFGFFGSGSNNNSTPGPGFTGLYTTTNGGGTNWSFTRSQYQVFTATQTNYTAAFGSAASNWGVIFNALSTAGGTQIPPISNVEVTQASVEEFGTQGTQVQEIVTIVAAEHWFSASTSVPSQAIVTQVSLEQWVKVPPAIPPSVMGPYAMILA